MLGQSIPGSMGSIAAVVVTYNRQEMLQQVLTAIAAQTHLIDEVILVDNDSRDGTEAMVRESYPQITYIHLGENLGPAGGFSVGIKTAYERGHDWMWLCEDDALPEPAALEHCLGVAEELKRHRVAMISPARFGQGGVFGFGALWQGRQFIIPPNSQPAPWYDVDLSGFIGALLARDAVQKAGYPRTDLFMEWEEAEYSLRLRRAGFRIIKLPVAWIHHLDDWQGISAPWRGCYYLTRNWLVMALEHRSPSELWWWAIYQLKSTVATLIYRDAKLECLRLRLLGIWHGLTGKMGRRIEPT